MEAGPALAQEPPIIIITGFGLFGGVESNPTDLAMQHLASQGHSNTHTIPVSAKAVDEWHAEVGGQHCRFLKRCACG